MTPTSKTLPNTLPKTIVVVDREVVAKSQGLAKRGQSLAPLVGRGNLEQADALLKELTAVGKDIEANRVSAKRIPLELGRGIDGAAKEIAEPVEAARQALINAIAAVERELERERREAEEQARREAAAREEERQRREEEREAALVAQARREAALAEKAAGVPVEVPPDVVIPPPPPEPEPVVLPAVPETPKTSVTRRKDLKPEVVNPLLITPRAVDERDLPRVLELLDELGGYFRGAETLVKPDKAAIKRALRAGFCVPGVKLVEREVLGSR